MAGFVAVFLKEFAHIRREPTTLFFSFFVPVLQSIVFGFAINTEIKNIPMVVLDLDGRREARELRDAFENTHTFRITELVLRDEDFDHALRSGKAKVGLRIPANYSDRLLLLTLSLLFLLCALGLGLLVSALAKTQLQAIQFAFIIMLPSVLLSGFMFPRSEMPGPIYLATFAIPVTYYLEILRAIVLRGAGLADIIPSVVGLIVSTAAILGLSLSRFRKQLG